MLKLLTLSSLALAATMVLAVPAFAQEASISDEDVVVIADYRLPKSTPPAPDDFIVVADLRLPTLGDLSKERWNQVHRRYDSKRGRREKIRA